MSLHQSTHIAFRIPFWPHSTRAPTKRNKTTCSI